MRKLFFSGEFLVIAVLVLCLGYIYRGVVLHHQVVFPSNFLASFYSPWATQKFAEYPNGIPNKPIGGNDSVRMFYPYRSYISDSLSHGQWPLWNPYNFSGSPLLANFQSALFYPLNLVYFVLPQIYAWSLLVFLQPLLGTVFMYLYLRLFIRERLAVLLGSLAFGFSGGIITWSMENAAVGQVELWFPLILYCVERFVARPTSRFFVFLVLVLSCCLLAGHFQFAFSVLLTGFLYGLVRSWQLQRENFWRVFGLIICAFLSVLFLCAVQLLPSFEALGQSPRSSTTSASLLSTYLVPVTQFVSAIAPDIYGNPGSYNYFGRGFYQEIVFYIGVIPLVFGLLACFTLRSNKIVKFFFWASIVTFFLAVRSPFTWWFYQLPLPLINTFTPSRNLFITSGSLAILAAFGFSAWMNGGLKAWRHLIPIILVLVGFLAGTELLIFLAWKTNAQALLWILSYMVRPISEVRKEDLMVSVKNVVLPIGMLAFLFISLFMTRGRRYFIVGVVLLTGLGQLYFLNKYLVLGDPKFLYPKHFVFEDISGHQGAANRFLTFGLPILGNIGLDKKVFSPDGIDPAFPGRYGELLNAAKKDGKFSRDIPRIEANLSEYSENQDIVGNARRLKLINLLGVTRVYNYELGYKDGKAFERIFPSENFTTLWKRDGWQSYENKTASPRVFLADSYIIESEPQKSIDRIFDAGVDLRKTIVLAEKPEGFVVDKGKGEATITSYSPQRVAITTSSESAKLLFLSDNYYPGWVARVDGKENKIYRADYSFRAVVVPKGEHEVIFYYEPWTFKTGGIISLISMGALLLLLFSRVTFVATPMNIVPDTFVKKIQ